MSPSGPPTSTRHPHKPHTTLHTQRMDTSGRTVLGAGAGQEEVKKLFGKVRAHCTGCCFGWGFCVLTARWG